MEALSHVQSLLMENAFVLGCGFLFIILAAIAIWVWMSSRSTKSPVLENQARINSAELGPEQNSTNTETANHEESINDQVPTEEASGL